MKGAKTSYKAFKLNKGLIYKIYTKNDQDDQLTNFQSHVKSFIARLGPNIFHCQKLQQYKKVLKIISLNHIIFPKFLKGAKTSKSNPVFASNYHV